MLFPVIFAYYCGGTYQKPISENISSVENQNIVIDSTLAADSLLEVFIKPYRSELNRTMGVVIGHANSDLFKGKPEAPLNNFVADLMLKRANRDFNEPVDAAMTNVGGLRINIPRGPITVGKIYEVMPFENELVVLELSGQQLWELGEELGQVNGEPVAGMQLKYLDKKIVQFKIQGNDVRKDKIYFVVTTDYLSSKGRNKFKVLGQAPRTFIGVSLRDAIIDEIRELEKSGKAVEAEVDGRIIFNKSKKRKLGVLNKIRG